MAAEIEVTTKTDNELLEIWEHQNDYITEMVTRVKAEIERRNLDTSGIHVIAVEEKKEAAQSKSDRNWARATALYNGVVALPFVGAFLGTDVSFVERAPLLVVGLLLMAVSFGVWMRKRWALIFGLILYAPLAVMGGFFIIVEFIYWVIRWRKHEAFRPPNFLGVICGTLVCLLMAGVFNSLRKRLRRKETSKSI